MTTPARETINLAEIERLAKACRGHSGYTVANLMEFAGMKRAPAEFIHAVSPDVVLRLVAAIRDMAEHRALTSSGKIRPGVYRAELAEHGITDEAGT